MKTYSRIYPKSSELLYREETYLRAKEQLPLVEAAGAALQPTGLNWLDNELKRHVYQTYHHFKDIIHYYETVQKMVSR